MNTVLQQQLPPATAKNMAEDFAAISRLLVRGLISTAEAQRARERGAEIVREILSAQPPMLEEAV